MSSINLKTPHKDNKKPNETPMEQVVIIEHLVRKKYKEYVWNARIYCAIYYCNRVLAGLSVGFLPIIVTLYPGLAIVPSIILILVTVLDFVFNPKKRWKTFSHATDRLFIAALKAQGVYEENKEVIKILSATERERVEGLVDIDNVKNEVLRSVSSINKISDKVNEEDKDKVNEEDK